MVLLGTGIAPNTNFVSGLKKSQDGGIMTDVFLKSSNPNVFAAGDIATFPYFYSGNNTRVEHYNSAIYQGYIAALNMLGRQAPLDEVPFFWTRFWNMSLAYAGTTNKFDDVHIEGNVE